MTPFRRVAGRAGQRGEASAPDARAGLGDRFCARFTATDALVLRDLVGQVAELVGGPDAGGGAAGSGERPSGERPSGGPDWPGGQGAGDLADLLGVTENARPPQDPVLARLLPDAYPGDAGASSEFRRYTERDLRDGKVAAAGVVLATLPERGGRVSLSATEAQTWLRALNDIRLALGVRLGIASEADADAGRMNPQDPRYGAIALYDWLSAIQDSLVRALS